MKPYTPDDAGCYVDGARGIYAIDEQVAIARAHGATITHDCEELHAETCFESEFAGCEWAGDYADKADDYMNTHFPVEGHYWGWNNGDWGLWAIDEEDA